MLPFAASWGSGFLALPSVQATAPDENWERGHHSVDVAVVPWARAASLGHERVLLTDATAGDVVKPRKLSLWQ